jgi:putative ABC transport system permease protein
VPSPPFGRDLGLGGRVLRFVGGFLLTLLVGPGILLAASWALGAALGKVLFYFGVAAVAVTEVALVIWLVIQVVKAVRGGGFASDLPEIRSDPATDRLSGENARRSPGRTAATAAALMIGLALVTFIAVLANGLKSSTRGAIEDQVTAQYMQTAQDGFSPFAPNATTALARSPEVEVASAVRGALAKIAGQNGQITGIDPNTITKVYKFDWQKGSDATVHELGDFGAIVEKQFEDDANLKVGDRFT